MAFTKVVGAGIHTLSNITSHNINSSGIITATKFVGPFDGTSGTFSGNVTIGGNLSVAQTVTYEDVKNVDSVGIGTFGEGIFIPDDKSIRIGNTFANPDLKIASSSSSEQVVVDYARSGTGKHLRFRCTDLMFENYNGLTRIARFQGGVGAGHAELYHAGSKKFETTSSGVSIGGTTIITSASGGKLGVGTDNPAKQVHIEGAEPFLRLENTHTGSKRLDLRVEDSDNNAYISAAQSGQYLKLYGRSGFTIATDSETDERLRITSDGKVGLGTDAPATNLHINAPVPIIRFTDSDTGQYSDILQSGNSLYLSGDRGASGSGGIIFRTQGTDEKVRITSAGLVGIGTDDPSTSLHVYHATTNGVAVFQSGDAFCNLILQDSNSTTSSKPQFGVQGDDFRFISYDGSSSTEKLRIASDGKIGIGGATSPEELLDLGNALQINLKVGGRAYLGQGYSTAATILGHSVKAKTTGTVSGGMEVTETNSGGGAPAAIRMQSGRFEFHTAGSGTSGATFDSERLRITSDGKVSISSDGTADGLLTIKGNSDATTTPSIRLLDGTDTREVSISNSAGDFVASTHGTDNAQHGFIKLFESGIFSVATGGTDERLRITSDGKVGINQTSPTAELEVKPTGTNTTSTIFIHAPQHNTNVASEAILKFGYGHSGSPDAVGHIKMIENANNSFDGDLKIALPFNNGLGGSVTTERIHLDGTYGRLGLNSSSFADTSTALVVRNGRSSSDHTMLDIICNDNETVRIMFSEDSNHGRGQIRYTYTGDNNYMSFYTNGNSSGNERLRIDNQGKLIMGSGGATNDTSERFLVDGSGSNDHCGLGIKTNNNVHDGYIAFHDTDATYRGKIVYDHQHDDMYFNTNGGNEKLRITSEGQITTRGATGTTFNNVGTADFGSFLVVNGGHTTNEFGILSLEGNANGHGQGAGHIQFINQANGNGSSGSNVQSRLIARIDAYTETSDTNANDDSGGTLRFFTKEEGVAPKERLTIKGNGRIGINETNPDRDLQIQNQDGVASGGTIRLVNRSTSMNNGQIAGLIEFEQRDSNTPGVSATIRSEMQDTTNGNCMLAFQTGTPNTIGTRLIMHGAGTITVPLSPTQFPDGTAASALVNTSGRQPNNGNDFQTNYKQNLSAGWYTIAVSNGGRSFGRMGIRETYSSRHQACTFYAGHHYGGSTLQNSIHVITSGRHSGDPLGALRIKAYGTYDGAMLQVYLRDGTNGVQAFLLGDNIQTHGWIMKDWVADGTDPGDLVNWSNIDTHGGVAAHVSLTDIQAGGTATDGHIIPGRDDATDLGTPNFRFDDVFATNTTITATSDERLKQDIASLTTAEMNAAKRISALFKTYRWKNRVLEKGDKARTHTGVIAQQVKAALEAEGLDYAKYGFIGFDEWYEDSEGTKLPIDAPTRQGDPIPVDTNAELGGNIVVPAGFEKKSRYSIRIGELLAFIAAYNEQRFTSIESRLSALESS